MKIYYLLLVGLLAACSASPSRTETVTEPTAKSVTFVLVRHAEKADDGTDDPPLTPAGVQRAERLAYLLRHLDVAGVYTTPYRRAEYTGFPVAKAHGLAVQTYDPDLDLQVLVDSLRQLHAGRTVLVVGHGTTVPGMLNVLVGEKRYTELTPDFYEDLYFVHARPGQAEVMRLAY